jgi:hypothetical protein
LFHIQTQFFTIVFKPIHSFLLHVFYRILWIIFVLKLVGKLFSNSNKNFFSSFYPLLHRRDLNLWPGNTKGGSITVPLTSCFTSLVVHFLAKLQYYASIEVYGETKVSPRQAKSCIQGNDMKDGRSVFLFPFFPLLLQFFYFVFFEFFGCQEDVGAFYRELGELAEVSKPFHLCSPCSLEFSRWVTRQTFWSWLPTFLADKFVPIADLFGRILSW